MLPQAKSISTSSPSSTSSATAASMAGRMATGFAALTNFPLAILAMLSPMHANDIIEW
ncbi:predicted protein [Plenodomus lingam JN3]|uniref:Predicted protein n=1 Tax=Leptosphaeria maculans (strain JN3 / isolate v23.1.3 / race Av1-4-5-6-7-8) TaxID=985895 RepID=E5A4L8_LEPMJ|nr:predicted protein [Plenodomus lingam JN3]CBX98566.1 predicted protein [Plenodomus lingam JN3]